MRRFSQVILVVAALASVDASAGPVSELYVTDGQTIWVLQGPNTNRQWNVHHGPEENGIAVRNTVRTIGAHPNTNPLGAEYTLGGTWTGVTYSQPVPPPPPLFEILDGTTDGRFNYGWDQAGGVLFRYDLNWANPTIEFNHGTADGNRIGVTYDPTNDSFWTSGLGAGPTSMMIENWSRSGTLLSSFSTGHPANYALALDPADQTLWLYSFTAGIPGALHLEQYSRSGALLSREFYPSFAGRKVTGGEFGFAIPEPSTCMLFAIAITPLLLERRKRRHQSGS